MSHTLEAIRHKPLAYWALDDSTPFVESSGYARSGVASGSPVTHISLAKGAVYSTIFDKATIGTFAAPVYQPGSEDNPFSLSANVKVINETYDAESQLYRENLFVNPRFPTTSFASSAGAAGTMSVGTDTVFGGYVRKTWTANSTGASNNGVTISSIAATPGTTYSASIIGRCSKVQLIAFYMQFLDSGGVNIGNNIVTLLCTANTSYSLSHAAKVAPDGTVNVRLLHYGLNGTGSSDFLIGDTLDTAQVLLERSSTNNVYIDGSMLGYQWTGTANASTSISRPEISAINVATSSAPSGLGTVTINTGISYAGRTDWNRVTTTSTFNGVRQNITLADLIDGQTYQCSILLANDGVSAKTVTLDWCDAPGGQSFVIQPSEVKRVSISGVRSDYTSTFRFFDIALNAIGNILYQDEMVVPGLTLPSIYFDGSTPGAEWVGTPNSTSSILLVSNEVTQVLSNQNIYDGLTVDGTKVAFTTKYTSSGECRAEYDIQVPRTISVVGVYGVQKNSLYIDGQLVAETEVNESQINDTFAAGNGSLYSGLSVSSNAFAGNGFGIFNYALGGNQIQRLYASARPDTYTTPIGFGGEIVETGMDSTGISLQQTWQIEEDWESGFLQNTIIEDNEVIPTMSNGLTLRGWWLTAFPLDAIEATSIYGVIPYWEGIGVRIEVSLDGTTWVSCVKGQSISLISPGYNPTGQNLQIRVVFDEGLTEAYLSKIIFTALTSGGYSMLNSRAITVSAPAYPGFIYPVNDLNDNWGTQLKGGTQTIATDGSSTGTYELWVKKTGNTPLTITPSGTTYVNGSAAALSTLVYGAWSLIHITATPASADLVISGDIRVGRVAFYPTQYSAGLISDIYKAYTGQNILVSDDIGVVGVTESAAAGQIYAHDWAILSSG